MGSSNEQDAGLKSTAARLIVKTHAQVASLEHVMAMIDSYLALPPSWTLELASERGFVPVLDHLLTLEWSGVSPYFRSLRFGKAIEAALSSNYEMAVVSWWMTRYLPAQEARVTEIALRVGNVQALVLLQSQGVCIQDFVPLRPRLSARECKMALWLHKNLPDVQLNLGLSPYVIGSPVHQYMEYVKWAVQHHTYHEITVAMDTAAAHGQLDDLKWLHGQTQERCTRVAFGAALRNGHLATAQWLYETYPADYFDDPWQLKCEVALARWALMRCRWQKQQHRVACCDNSVRHACMNRAHDCSAETILQVVQFLCSVRQQVSLNCEERAIPLSFPEIDIRYRIPEATEAMDIAASRGLLDVVRWLHRNQNDGCTTKAMDQAATNGHLHVVQWLHLNRSEGCTSRAMRGAIRNNHFQLVKWLHENRTEGCHPQSMDQAAGRGDLELVRWLHANRAEGCTANAINFAAALGDIKMVQWLHENLPQALRANAMDFAAKYGHWDVLKYLHAQQYQRTETALQKAIENGHGNVVTWLLKTGPSDSVDQKAVRNAANRGHLAVLAILCPRLSYLDWDINFLTGLAIGRQFGILEWALRSSLLLEDVLVRTSFQAH